MELVGGKMIGNLRIQQENDGQINIGVEHPLFGFLTILSFADKGKLRVFIDDLIIYYEQTFPRTKIPEVFIAAFKED